MLRKLTPGRDKRGVLGQTVIEQDLQLLRLKRMKLRLGLRSGPPLETPARKTAEAKPVANPIEGQNFESRAASISKNEDGALVRISRQLGVA